VKATINKICCNPYIPRFSVNEVIFGSVHLYIFRSFCTVNPSYSLAQFLCYPCKSLTIPRPSKPPCSRVFPFVLRGFAKSLGGPKIKIYHSDPLMLATSKLSDKSTSSSCPTAQGCRSRRKISSAPITILLLRKQKQ